MRSVPFMRSCGWWTTFLIRPARWQTSKGASRAGGLLSFGPNMTEMARRTAEYVDKIIKGAKPADLPIQQPTRFELIINAKAAKEMGLDVSPILLARADEVIE